VYSTVLLPPAVKQQQQALMAGDACSTPMAHLFITNRGSNLRFLVDTRYQLCVFPQKARPRAQETHQLRPLRSQRCTHNKLRVAHPHAQPRTSMGFHVAFRGCRCPNSNYRGGPARQFQPFGGLPQQQDPGRDYFLVSTSPDGIPSVPECKDHWVQSSGGRHLRLVPRPYTPLASPA